MLEISILGFLYEEDLNGYELKKRISSLAGYYTKISDGSLYPAIKRLEKKGFLLRAESEEGNSRISYVLNLTERGREEFLDLMRHPSEIQITDRNKYFTILAFLHLLDRDDQLKILKRRYDFISSAGGFFYNDDSPLKENDVASPYRKGMYAIAKATSKAERKWLSDTIESLSNT